MSNKPKFLRNKHRLQKQAQEESMIADNDLLTKSEVLAQKRWDGAQKMLSLIARGTSVQDNSRGMFLFQQKYMF